MKNAELIPSGVQPYFCISLSTKADYADKEEEDSKKWEVKNCSHLPLRNVAGEKMKMFINNMAKNNVGRSKKR